MHSLYYLVSSSCHIAQSSYCITHPYYIAYWYTGILFQWYDPSKSFMDAYMCALKNCSRKRDMPRFLFVFINNRWNQNTAYILMIPNSGWQLHTLNTWYTLNVVEITLEFKYLPLFTWICTILYLKFLILVLMNVAIFVFHNFHNFCVGTYN